MIEGLVLVQKVLMAVAAGYLLGALPFAQIASRLRGFDVFDTGSTLAGTANVSAVIYSPPGGSYVGQTGAMKLTKCN